jgi:amino acid transporter
MNIVAVVGLRWIARSARLGAPSVTLWVLACLAFFLPLALTVAELSNRYPEQGGMYAWVRRAFGPVHGFVCGWCLWVNNLFYFPSLLLFAAANALVMFGDSAAGLAENRAYSVGFVLLVLWALIGLNIVGLTQGKRLQNLGSVATWLPAALLIIFGAIAGAAFGSATSFAPEHLWPREDAWNTIGVWSAMCFAFSGFEITSLVSQEVRDPERTIPRGVVISGIVVTLIYIAGSASVLVALPANALAERSGISDAIDHVLPAAFARLHPVYRTPHVSLIIQGLAATFIFLASVFLTISGGQTTIQEAYDILVNLTILIYFVPYLYLFVALIRLRQMARPIGTGESSFRVPGGTIGVIAVATVGFLATAISVGLVFVPPGGTANVLNYEANLIGQAAIILAVGWVLFWRARRTTV